MTALVAVVAVLAVYRVTMLVTSDVITKPWRDAIIDRYVHPAHEMICYPVAREPETEGDWPYVAECRCGEKFVGDVWVDVAMEANGHTNPHQGEMTKGPRWLVLLDCPWCASWWVAVPVSWSAWTFGTRAWWFVPAFALAASAVTGIVAKFAKPES